MPFHFSSVWNDIPIGISSGDRISVNPSDVYCAVGMSRARTVDRVIWMGGTQVANNESTIKAGVE